MKGLIYKEVNSPVWSMELYENKNYLLTKYFKYKYNALEYCNKNNINTITI